MRFIMYVVLVIFILFQCMVVCSAKEATTTNKTINATYPVPTEGKIMDVTYHPEYDQWWVKCREKNNIAIYTYDEYSKQWGCVVFTPKKPTAQQIKTEKSKDKKSESKTTLNSTKPKPQLIKPGKKEEKPVGQEKPAESKKTQKKDESKQQKWINPFDMLRKGAEIFRGKPEEK